MSLRLQAAADAQAILENADDFGWPITVTSPEGVSEELTGLSADIGMAIDPETGQAVSGRTAHVSIAIKSLTDAGFTVLPRGIPEASSRPWRIRFEDLQGNPQTFKVVQTKPDRTLGILVCTLEALRAAE